MERGTDSIQSINMCPQHKESLQVARKRPKPNRLKLALPKRKSQRMLKKFSISLVITPLITISKPKQGILIHEVQHHQLLMRVWSRENSGMSGGNIQWHNHFGIPGTGQDTHTLRLGNSTPRNIL